MSDISFVCALVVFTCAFLINSDHPLTSAVFAAIGGGFMCLAVTSA